MLRFLYTEITQQAVAVASNKLWQGRSSRTRVEAGQRASQILIAGREGQQKFTGLEMKLSSQYIDSGATDRSGVLKVGPEGQQKFAGLDMKLSYLSI